MNSFHSYHGGFWLRVFGLTICVNNHEINLPPFSVRNGYHKEYRVGKWGIKFFKRG